MTSTITNRVSLGFALLLLAAINVHSVQADENQEIVLTISGEVGAVDLEFNRDALLDLGSVTFSTETIWLEGERTFEGVLLSVLLEAVKASGSSLEATAINDYVVSIPVSDATDDGPIIAVKMDGELMHARGKGPLWIVYPYDSKLEYQTEVIYTRSIWQLERIVVLR